MIIIGNKVQDGYAEADTIESGKPFSIRVKERLESLDSYSQLSQQIVKNINRQFYKDLKGGLYEKGESFLVDS